MVINKKYVNNTTGYVVTLKYLAWDDRNNETVVVYESKDASKIIVEPLYDFFRYVRNPRGGFPIPAWEEVTDESTSGN